MGLLSSIQRKQSPETRKRTPPPQDPALVSALRTRARRRLIGTAVLVAGAVVALPAVFDTKPRPAVNNLAIRVTPADGSPAAVVARSGDTSAPVTGRTEPGSAGSALPRSSATGASRAAGTQSLLQARPGRDDDIVTEEKPDAGTATGATATAATTATVAAAAQQKRDRDKERERVKAEKARAEKAREAAREKADKAEKATEAAKARAARAALEGNDEEDKPQRYVVQVGSFAEARTVRDMRQRVSDLGMRSHEQKVETASGEERTRVRLGPFKTKEEAQQAAARLKAAGMKAAVLPR